MERFVERIEMELTNIGLFREFALDLESGAVVEASGGNGRGKTTLMNALLMQLTGKGIADFTTTYGEEAGEIATRIDGIKIRRVIKEGKTLSLEVIDEHGQLVKRPQGFLNTVFGAGAYLNPMELIEMRPADRAKAVAAALDIDPAVARRKLEEIAGHTLPELKTREDIFPTIQRVHDTLYEQRRQARVDADAADAQADGVIDFVPAEWFDAKGEVPAPVEPPALGDVYDKKSAIEERNLQRRMAAETLGKQEQFLLGFNNDLDGQRLRVQEMERQADELGAIEDTAAMEEEIAKLTALLQQARSRNLSRQNLAEQLANARATIDAADAKRLEYEAKLAGTREKVHSLGGEESTAHLQEQIDNHKLLMETYKDSLKVWGERNVRYAQITDLRDKAEQLRGQWEVLQAKVKAVDELPLQLLAGVKLPIDGMVISGDTIFLPEDDKLLDLDGFGDADKLRYCTQLAMALAPINVLVIDGVEKCDEDRRAMLYQMIADAGFCALSTRVTGGPLKVDKAAVAAERPPAAPTPVEMPVTPAAGEPSVVAAPVEDRGVKWPDAFPE